jgi:cyclophilin family peptidyl-prolyl cis-trans isomerase
MGNRFRLTILIVTAVAVVASCDSKNRRAKVQSPEPNVREKPDIDWPVTKYFEITDQNTNLIAEFDTSLGDIHCRLYPKKAPRTTANFVGLATGNKKWRTTDTGKKIEGKPFYNGTTFYRVVPNFAIFAGDRSGSGKKGPGFEIDDEFHPDLSHDRPGTLSMASKGPPDTGGSRFFITLRAIPRLDGKHSIFGHCRNLDVIRAISQTPTSPGYEPEEPPKIHSITFSQASQFESLSSED